MKRLYQIFKQSTSVSIDTRNIKGGELFFCLRGERFNGNKFANQALERGASYVVVDDAEYYSGSNDRMILVQDSLKSLQSLAQHHREQLHIPVIGITGTNGKTTTKELVAAVLNTQFNCLYTQGNFNNHIGVPLTLLRMTQNHDMAVVEMGANHPGEIDDLCQFSQPNYGIITNIGKAHLEGFGSFEHIIETKMALYQSLKKVHGLAFVNQDDVLLMREASTLAVYSYGQSPKANVQVSPIENDSYLSLQWGGRPIHTKLFGWYNLNNVAAAIAVGNYFKVPDEKIVYALESYAPSNNRSQLEKGRKNEIILDAYNANPNSMTLSLVHFQKSKAPRKAAILGDMLELGAFENQEHKSILELVCTLDIDETFFVGQAFYVHKDDYARFHFFRDTSEAKKYFMAHQLKAYRILLKGSRGISLETLKEQLL